MIVVDASAVLELLLGTGVGHVVDARLRTAETICAPHLLLTEVAQVLRRVERAGEIRSSDVLRLFDDLSDLDIEFYDHSLVTRRVWALRGNLTAYDATYVALSEILACPLLTTDAKLAAAPGNKAVVELL